MGAASRCSLRPHQFHNQCQAITLIEKQPCIRIVTNTSDNEVVKIRRRGCGKYPKFRQTLDGQPGVPQLERRARKPSDGELQIALAGRGSDSHGTTFSRLKRPNVDDPRYTKAIAQHAVER